MYRHTRMSSDYQYAYSLFNDIFSSLIRVL